ncbi:MAG: hypothetical protein JW876_12155, partial [Candidatus Krumholzibacteriota bacterium]|nr:hypothetical protein [Candidatus Krumholzibacteriota bacterium]
MRSRWKAALTSSLVLFLAVAAEGETIRRVEWRGASAVSPGEIARLNPIAAGRPFSDSLVAAGLHRADSLFFVRGFLSVRYDVDTLRAGSGVDVTIVVREGAPAVLGELSLSGTGAISREAALAALGLRGGDRFEASLLGDGMRRLLSRYTDGGFPWAQVWLTGFSHDEERNAVDLSFSVFEGEPSTVAAVLFEGIARTDTAVALRVSRLRAGEPYQEAAVALARRRLISSKLFAGVGEPEVRRRGGGAVEIALPVVEVERANAFQGAFGFSQKENGDYRLNGSAMLDLRNIAGTGRDAQFDWLNDGEDYSRIDIAYLEPFLFGSR